MRFSHPFIAELKRYVANQKSNLSPFILSISDIINTASNGPNTSPIVIEKQKKLSEVTDMIHAAYVFHRCIQDENHHLATVKRDNIMSLLIGDYLLAQSSVDLAEIRWPETVGLIARGLEDYTRGEFMKLNSTATSPLNMEVYSELTCGSLLANACKSASLLGGEKFTRFNDLVYSFGLHAGTAHRLMECSNMGDTANTSDSNKICFKKLAKYRIDQAISSLFKLPDVEQRSYLLNKLDEIMLDCR